MRNRQWLIGPIGASLVMLASTVPASAYIGPEVGSAAVQSLIASLSILAGVLGAPYLRLKSRLTSLVSRFRSGPKQPDGS